MKTFSTKTLITILAVVLAVYFGLDFLDSGESTEKIPALLAEFDPKSVTEARITQEGKTLRIYRDDNRLWKLDLGDFQPKADSQIVLRCLNNLSNLRPSRIISKNPQSWGQYQVDSSGIRTQLFASGKKICDVYLGGLMPSGRELMSFVRAEGSNLTYVVAGFAAESVSSKDYIYRPKTLATCFKDSVEKIVCSHPGGEKFEMVQVAPKIWKIGNQNCDSAASNNWAMEFESLASTDFVDGFSLEQPIATLEIYLKSEPKKIEISLFEDSQKRQAFVSSLNPENSFSAEQLRQKVFKTAKELTNPTK